jgi:hypothetical protein
MPKSDPVEQLRTLNELLARTGASAPDRAEHARRALDFFSQEQGARDTTVSLGDCAGRLARLHFGAEGESELAYTHWHVPTVENFSPLWIRQAIVVEMKKLAGRRAALLLVTGLREAICPAGAYWTKSRQLQYDRVRDWIDELACAWATRGSQLQVVVL